MAKKCLSALLALVTLTSAGAASAQWLNHYPKTEPFAHQLYVEQEHLPILSSGPTYPAPSPDGKSLAVSHQGWIWLLNLKTGVATRLTNDSAIDARPRWSPDGSRIAFVRDSGTDTSVVIARLDGGPELVIDTPAIELDPEFTKDGEYLVYTSARAGRLDLWRRDLESGSDTALTQDARLRRAARSLRDGGLVYHDMAGRSYGVRHLDADGKTSRILFEQGWMAHLNPDTHPTERAIVFGVGDGNHVRLAVMDIDQPAYPRWLTPPGEKALFPAWSADGSRIYYVLADKRQQFALMVIDAAGGEPKRVPVDRWDYGGPMGDLAIVVHGVDGRTAPARLSITRSDGHPLVNPAGATFVDNQNGIGYFYTDGHTRLQLPEGEYRVVATRGPFSLPRETAVRVRAGIKTEITLDITEIWNAQKAGYVSADHHVHLNGSGVNELELESLLLLMQGERLDVAAPMAWNQHNRFIDAERIGQQVTAADGTTAMLSQEVRSDYHGHIGLIGARKAFQPWFFGPDVPVYGNRDLHTGLVSDFAEANGAFATYVHPVERDADPFDDLAANELPYDLVLDGVLTDGMGLEIVCQWTSSVGTAAAWYRFLNIGRVMPATAGTDMMANFYRLPAIGTARAYVPATSATDRYAAATVQVRSGKGFVTTGPALLFEVDGTVPGGVVEKGRRAWTLDMTSVRPVERVEIVVNGRIVQTLAGFDGNGTRSYAGTVDLPSGGWLAARAVGGKTAWPIMSYAHFAHTQPIWIGRVGSIEPAAARAAATDLLAALAYSEGKFAASYGKSVPPGLTARVEATRKKLAAIAARESP
jgi:TolB protein